MKIRMEAVIWTTLLGKALIEKRGIRPLREVAEESKIPTATFNRLEHGREPDLDTFIAAMVWLGIHPREWQKYTNMEIR